MLTGVLCILRADLLKQSEGDQKYIFCLKMLTFFFQVGALE